MLGWLKHLKQLATDILPVEQPMKYGNKSFRTWLDRVRGTLPEDLKALFPATPDWPNCIAELRFYAEESFGSYDKLDYTTAHEFNFLLLLMAFFKMGVLIESDLPAVALRVFVSYIELCRMLQRNYALEPSGSDGWGLDDY